MRANDEVDITPYPTGRSSSGVPCGSSMRTARRSSCAAAPSRSAAAGARASTRSATGRTRRSASRPARRPPRARGAGGAPRSELSPRSHDSRTEAAHRASSSSRHSAPKRMSRASSGLLGGQPAGHVVGGDVLVHRVRLDVLVEEGRRVLEPQPPQTVGVAAVRLGRGDLEHREVADDRSPPAPLKAEHRHQVDRGEGDTGDPVQVGAVRPNRGRAPPSPARTGARVLGRRAPTRTRRTGPRAARLRLRPRAAGSPSCAGSASFSW